MGRVERLIMSDQQPRALRYNRGKPILSRLLCFPAALAGVAKVTEFGERKYEAFNFTKGAPLSESLDCLLRHLVRYWCRVETDPESDLMELNAAAWNTLRACDEAQLKPKGFVDDRPPAGTYDPEQILALFAGTFEGQILKSLPPPEPVAKTDIFESLMSISKPSAEGRIALEPKRVRKKKATAKKKSARR
jgi:hypothetical protein